MKWIALAFLVTAVLAAHVGATNLAFTPIGNDGRTQTFVLEADEFPLGLAGYDGVVEVSPPNIVTITKVSFPQWGVLNYFRPYSNSSAKISAVDILRRIQRNSTKTPLAYVTVTGLGSGEATLKIKNVWMDADGGYKILTDTEPYKFEVE